jgi:hypothetical protein
MGLLAALAAANDWPREEQERFLLVCFFAVLFPAEAEGAGGDASFPAQLQRRLRELAGDKEIVSTEIEGYLAFSRPARQFVTYAVAERLAIPDAVASLTADPELAGRAPLAAFVRAFGVWPRGSYLRLSDGSIGCVLAPAQGGVIVIRMLCDQKGVFSFLPPAILVAGPGEDCDVVGPVRFPERVAREGMALLEKQ